MFKDTRQTCNTHPDDKVKRHPQKVGTDSPDTCHPNFHCYENLKSYKIDKKKKKKKKEEEEEEEVA